MKPTDVLESMLPGMTHVCPNKWWRLADAEYPETKNAKPIQHELLDCVALVSVWNGDCIFEWELIPR